MPNIKGEKQVKPFHDSDSTINQSVFLDTDDCGGWTVINHGGEEISLSVEDWNSLVELVNSALQKGKLFKNDL
jgi:hypothetical protein